jgi:hypothetical protein
MTSADFLYGFISEPGLTPLQRMEVHLALVALYIRGGADRLAGYHAAKAAHYARLVFALEEQGVD